MAFKRPALTSALCYRDPRAAIAFLEQAFDFELVLLLEDADGAVAHSEMRFRDAIVMVGSEWTAEHKSPASIDGLMTQTVHVQLDQPGDDIGAHCARAREAGAKIIAEPEDQFYGDRTYRCKDPEGHIWTIGQTIEEVASEAWDAATGLRTTVNKL